MQQEDIGQVDIREHQETFHHFARGIALFAAHVAVVLIILGLAFA